MNTPLSLSRYCTTLNFSALLLYLSTTCFVISDVSDYDYPTQSTLSRESVLRIINLTVAKDWFCPRIYRLPAKIFLPCPTSKPEVETSYRKYVDDAVLGLPYVDLLIKSKHMHVKHITTYSLLIYTLYTLLALCTASTVPTLTYSIYYTSVYKKRLLFYIKPAKLCI
jgi:hypothetical protein